MTLIDLLTATPPRIPVGVGRVHLCEDDLDETNQHCDLATKYCKACDTDQLLSNFYFYVNRNMHSSECRACMIERSRQRRLKGKK